MVCQLVQVKLSLKTYYRAFLKNFIYTSKIYLNNV